MVLLVEAALRCTVTFQPRAVGVMAVWSQMARNMCHSWFVFLAGILRSSLMMFCDLPPLILGSSSALPKFCAKPSLPCLASATAWLRIRLVKEPAVGVPEACHGDVRTLEQVHIWEGQVHAPTSRNCGRRNNSFVSSTHCNKGLGPAATGTLRPACADTGDASRRTGTRCGASPSGRGWRCQTQGGRC